MHNETHDPELYSGFFVLPVRYTVTADLKMELGEKVHLLARVAFEEIIHIGNGFNIYYHRFPLELEEKQETFKLTSWFNETDRFVEIDIEKAGDPITFELPDGFIDSIDEVLEN